MEKTKGLCILLGVFIISSFFFCFASQSFTTDKTLYYRISKDSDFSSEDSTWSSRRGGSSFREERDTDERAGRSQTREAEERGYRRPEGIWRAGGGIVTVLVILGVFIISVFALAFLRRKA